MDCSMPASLSFTVSRRLLKFMSIKSMVSSNYLISVAPFSSCPQSFPAPESFPLSWLFPPGGQSIGASGSALFLPMNIQDWFPLGLTGLISFLFKEHSWVFSSTTVWKHQFFGSQPSLSSNSHIHPYLMTGKTIVLTRLTFVSNVMSMFLICCLGLS